MTQIILHTEIQFNFSNTIFEIISKKWKKMHNNDSKLEAVSMVYAVCVAGI